MFDIEKRIEQSVGNLPCNLPVAATPGRVSSSGALGLSGLGLCVHEEALPFLSQLCQSFSDYKPTPCPLQANSISQQSFLRRNTS